MIIFIPTSPLLTIDWSQISPLLRKLIIGFDALNKHVFVQVRFPSFNFTTVILVSITVPYVTTVCQKRFDVSLTPQKPQQFRNHSFEMNFLSCKKWKPITHFVTNLSSEHRESTCTSAVFLLNSAVKNVLKQRLIMLV